MKKSQIRRRLVANGDTKLSSAN